MNRGVGEMSNDASLSSLYWSDVLSPRRNSSDVLWLVSHPWNSADNVNSRKRTALAVREDVFEEPVIKALLRESPHLRKKIEAILEEMAHNWSLKYIRFVGFFLTKVMKSIYRKVLVFDRIYLSKSSVLHPCSGITTISSVINDIAKKYPILYMPTHRSYADFLLFSYICFHMNLPLPSIAAGIDFLALNQVASLLRACGAFFIRRSFKNSGDSLYWHTFRAYVQTQLKGFERPMEFFVEGTRSRSGKFLYPKIGLLSIAVELLLTSQIPDLIIVPISITYDRTLEEELYAKELVSSKFHPSSGTKPKETTKHLLRGAKSILAQDFGSVYIRFGEPISVKELCDKRNLRKLYGLQSLETEITLDTQPVNFINYLSVKVIEEQKRLLVVSPFTILCLCIVSDAYRDSSITLETIRSLPVSQVVSDIEALCPLFDEQCLSHFINGRTIYEEFLECCNIHKKLVAFRNDNIAVAIGNPLTLTQLQHYSNQAFQLVINVALCCYSEYYNDFCILQDLLSREFIFPEIGSKHTYELALSLKRSLSARVIDVLSSETAYFIECYSNVLHLLKSFQSPFSSLKELIKLIHNNSEVTLDIVQNVVHLMCEKNIIRRVPSNVIDGNKLMLFHERIALLNNNEMHSVTQLTDSMKAKL